MSTHKSRLVLYCKSINNPGCGIASYTAMLAAAKNVPVTHSLPGSRSDIPAAIHIQHETGSITYEELKEITEACKEKGIHRWLTMHEVKKRRTDQPLYRLKLNIRKAGSLVIRSIQYGLLAAILRKHRKHYISLLVRHLEFNLPFWRRFQAQRYIFTNYQVIVHSASAKEELIQQGAEDSAVTVQHHPVKSYPTSPTLNRAADGKLHVGIFGFMSAQKHVALLIEACSNLSTPVQLHIFASTERIKNNVPEALKSLLRQAATADWISLHTETLPLEDIVFRLSRNCVNVYLTTPTDISSSGAIRQYLAAKRPIIAYRSPMVEDVLTYINVLDQLSVESLQRMLLNYKEIDVIALDRYLDENSWENSHRFYNQYLITASD
jgi:glycosyltransferase involved in cell wall biosynthesis